MFSNPEPIYNLLMLYLLHGSNIDKSRARAHVIVDSLLKKKPDAAFFDLNSENWSPARLEEYIGGQGLFQNKYIVFLDCLCEDNTIAATVVAKADDIAKSDNIFIFLERALTKELLKKIEKFAEKVERYDLKTEFKKKEEFPIFSISDAFGRRDKKNLWMLTVRGLRAGLEPEQIHGMILWQLKNILIALESKTAAEADMKSFVWNKSKSFGKNFSREELMNLSAQLVSLYHDARRGKHEMEIALERFVLNV